MLRNTLVPGLTNKVARLERPHWPQPSKLGWHCALELDENRIRRGGSEAELVRAINDGADLRVGSGFRHHEHIELNSTCQEFIREFADFRVTYVLDNRWSAGICNLRMPVEPPNGFGMRESMSFFLYNQDGLQALARPYLGGGLPTEHINASLAEFARMPRFRELDRADINTNAPSYTFVYDFDYLRFCVNERWREVLSHEADGTVVRGSVDELVDAFNTGAELKVAIRDLCNDLDDNGSNALEHEVFVHLGSCYYYTESKLFIASTHPVVRVVAAIPLIYRSRGWDFGWLLPRTDGHLARWLCNPYTLKFSKSFSQHAMRWFVGV